MVIIFQEKSPDTKFDLKVRLYFSEEIEEIADSIRNELREIEEEIFRGENSENHIEILDTGKNFFEIQILTSGTSKSHKALMRAKNILQKKLGPEYHIGIRKIETLSYEIRYETEKEPKEEIEMPFVKSINIEGKKIKLELEKMDETAFHNNYPDRILNRIDEKIRQQYISGKKEVTEDIKKSESKLEEYRLKENPTEQLKEKNWIKQVGRGIWTILPQYTALWKAIEELVMKKVAEPLDFKEIYLPKMVPTEIQRKKGQLSGIPNEIFWVCPPKTRDPGEWEDYKDRVKITGEEQTEKLRENIGEPKYSLAYAQCEPFYDIWEKKVMDREKMPIKFIDRYGPTYRYEAGGLRGVERLTEFRRDEFVFMGSPEEVKETRDKVKDRSLEIIDDIFDLDWELKSATPVYLLHSDEKDDEGKEYRGKDYVKTYDIDVNLPFGTEVRGEEQLEIASFHVHEDFYEQNFHWKERKDRKIWSGCAGISPTRWAYVLLIRHGFDFENWPEEIKNLIGEELPGLPEDLFM